VSAADDASLAVSLFAVDPAGLGGVCLRSLVQPARTQWLEMLRGLLPPAVPMRRIPFNIADGRLLGGLDLAATLKANRPIAERGALAATDGGVVVVTMAERLSVHTAACINAVLDSGEIATERDGVLIRDRARVGIVALDETMAFLVDLNGFDLRTPLASLHDIDEIRTAQLLLPRVAIPPELIEALCATAMALGAGSLRVSILGIKAARVLAALDGRTEVTTDDAVAAGRLVFAPRATTLPQSQSQSQPQPPPSQELGDGDPEPGETDARPADPGETSNDRRETVEPEQEELSDTVLAATEAAIPRGLLETLRSDAPLRSSGGGSPGRAGALRKGGTWGRPSGVRSGMPRGHARLNVMETLRAAAPWQRLRGRLGIGDDRLRLGDDGLGLGDNRVRIDASDFRVSQYRQRAQTLTIFAVDASGSSALNRLAEAKGAVELLLADCYVRRDQVAVVTFRGRKAEVLLPPTRSLVRAKRNLAGLPGGGGTPLAAAIDTALLLANQSRRRGETPLLVLLTDGRANVARNGSGGREAAHADALQAARLLRTAKVAALFVDTSPRPNPLAEHLASAMNAQYIPLPYANARSLSRVVTAATARATS